jgi:TP53 regulating kinase-like protein
MHDLNIVHGDLTTSNMIIRESNESLVRSFLRSYIIPTNDV